MWMVAGIVASEVWYEHSIPVVEFPVAELAPFVNDGLVVEVIGESGDIVFEQ